MLAIAPFPDREHPERNLQNLGTERFWLATYGGYYWPSGFGHNGEIAKLSPDYSAAELKIRDEAQAFSDRLMWDELGQVNLMDATRFKVPVIIFQGRHDRGTSSALATNGLPRSKRRPSAWSGSKIPPTWSTRRSRGKLWTASSGMSCH